MEQFKDVDKPKLGPMPKSRSGNWKQILRAAWHRKRADDLQNLNGRCSWQQGTVWRRRRTRFRQEQAALEGDGRADKKRRQEPPSKNLIIALPNLVGVLNGDIPPILHDFIRSNPSEERMRPRRARLTALHKEFMRDERIGGEKVKAFTERFKDIASA